MSFRDIARFGTLSAGAGRHRSRLESGPLSVKLNTVVARGMNCDEVSSFAALTLARPLHVRFIELMPMGETGFFTRERWVPLKEIMEKAGPIEALSIKEQPLGHGPARYYRRPGARGTIGFISALSCGFCASCNRMRLSSSGTLIPCLDAEDGLDLRAPLRAGAGPEKLKQLISAAAAAKPEEHQMKARVDAKTMNPRFMCQIGG